MAMQSRSSSPLTRSACLLPYFTGMPDPVLPISWPLIVRDGQHVRPVGCKIGASV